MSKEYFDAVVILDRNKEKSIHSQFVNDYKGIKSLCKWLKEQGSTFENTLVCLEHTGMYGKLIIKCLMIEKFSLWVEMSLKIRNIGVKQAKTTKFMPKELLFMP